MHSTSPRISYANACQQWRAALRADTLHGPFPPVRSTVRPAGHFLAIHAENVRRRSLYDGRSGVFGLTRREPMTDTQAAEISLAPFHAGTYRPGRYVATKSTSKLASADRPAAAPSYAAAVHSLASRVAEKHVRQARTRCEHLRAEFVAEAESAIGQFLALRLARFPRLASDLLARFALGALPSSTVRAMHRAARKACDARQRRMTGASKLVEPSFFNVFADEPEQSAELSAVFVNARIDSLAAALRERAGASGNAKRAAHVHLALLETARAYFLASIHGEAAELPAAGLSATYSETGYNVATLKRSKVRAQVRAVGERFASAVNPEPAGPVLKSEGETVRERDSFRANRGETKGRSEGGAERLTGRALYFRLHRMAKFLGAADILSALGRNNPAQTKGAPSRSTAWRGSRKLTHA